VLIGPPVGWTGFIPRPAGGREPISPRSISFGRFLPVIWRAKGVSRVDSAGFRAFCEKMLVKGLRYGDMATSMRMVDQPDMMSVKTRSKHN
jgi:hypothetical protein